jgi:hypothetical protein
MAEHGSRRGEPNGGLRFAINDGIPAGANSPPLSGSIALQLCVAKSCSAMKLNVVSGPGHRQQTLLGFS